MNIEKWFRRFKIGKTEGRKHRLGLIVEIDGCCKDMCAFGDICDIYGEECDLIMKRAFDDSSFCTKAIEIIKKP